MTVERGLEKIELKLTPAIYGGVKWGAVPGK